MQFKSEIELLFKAIYEILYPNDMLGKFKMNKTMCSSFGQIL